MSLRYNPPPGWKVPLGPDGSPHEDFVPESTWPEAPEDWQFWVLEASEESPNDSEPVGVDPDPEPEESASLAEPLTFDATGTAESGESPAVDEALLLDDQLLLQQSGIYDYHHPLEDSPAYEKALDDLRDEIKRLLSSGEAILSSTAFSFEGSFSAGQRMIKDLSQLCIRAFNSEVDISMRTMRAGSLALAKGRLLKSRQAIERLGARMGLRISDAFFGARLKELELVSDYLHKKNEEKEAARDERARLREEARVQKEIEEKGKDLRKELDRLRAVIQKLRSEEREDEARDIESEISRVEEAIEENDYRAANIRAGYVYVISNIGSLGENVVKIGLTRRLEPEERIKELSDASVPFTFDKHLIYFSDDAVGLEAELHAEFSERRVNVVNTRKEFFFVSPQEVQEALEERLGTLLEFNRAPVAEEFHQSKPYWA